MSLVADLETVRKRMALTRYHYLLDEFLDQHPDIDRDEFTALVVSGKYSDTQILTVLRKRGYTGKIGSIGSWRRAHVNQ